MVVFMVLFMVWFMVWFMVLVSGTQFIVPGVFLNVLLEHGGLPCIFPFNVYLDFGHHCYTQWYLGLLSEPYNPTHTF